MTLDVRTIFVMGSGFLVVTAVTLGLLARTLPRELRLSALTGTLATTSMAVAWALFAFEDALPDLATVLVANLTYLLSVTLIYQSVRLLDGLTPLRRVYLTVVAPAILANVAARYLVDDYPLRVIIMSVALGVMLALTAYRLFRPDSEALDTPGRRAAAWWLAVTAGVMLVRIVLTLVQGGAPPLLESGPYLSVSVAASIILAHGAIYAYFLLFSGRVTAELALQAHLDPLTDLLNRRAFEARSNQELKRAARDGTPVSLLMIDANRFKSINDTWGHAAGDAALKAIAAGLRGNLRPYDLVARLGGDEFAALLPGLDERSARALVPRLEAAIAAQPSGHPGALHVSIGSATTRDGAEDVHVLLGRADQDLYRVKQTLYG